MTTAAEIEAFMNEPKQRQTEVIVGHRYGYWMPGDPEELTTADIEEADAYLEAHIQWRISQALAEAHERR